ncbi:hypothetical protein EIK77_001213 [Talaromyces pinophilus]|nr:hypothetical protein EIK77_001213 [Talaromyces pinophilus]
MCGPIRSLTEGRGHEASKHHLASFGGAGGQHACAIAETLGIKKVLIHKYSSILSAYGIGLADVVHEEEKPCAKIFDDSTKGIIFSDLDLLSQSALNHHTMSRFSRVDDNRFLFMRYDGSETSMMIPVTEGVDPKEVFIAAHQQQFGFTPVNRKIFVDTLHVRAIGKNFFGSEATSQSLESTPKVTSNGPIAKPDSIKSVYFKSLGWVETPVYLLGSLSQGQQVAGPALIVDNTQTIVVNPNCAATSHKDLLILDVKEEKKSISVTILDPVQLSVFRHRFYGIAEQMGRVLQNISVSANIKERLDFSCAIFSPDGSLVANAPHVPAMIGSMGFAVKSQIKEWQGKLRDGDVLLSNSPGMYRSLVLEYCRIAHFWDT